MYMYVILEKLVLFASILLCSLNGNGWVKLPIPSNPYQEYIIMLPRDPRQVGCDADNNIASNRSDLKIKDKIPATLLHSHSYRQHGPRS